MKSKKIISAFLAAALILGNAAMPADSVIPTFAVEVSAESSSIPAPKSLTATVGSKKVTLKWNLVRDADGYRVYMYDAKTKKYKKVKSVKNNKVTISGLENGTTYKFKVAAMISLPDSYEVGALSEAVSATPSATAQKVVKKEMTPVKLTADEMKGTWEYYDFSEELSYTNGSKYNVNSEKYDYDPYLTQITVFDSKNVVILYDEEMDGGSASAYGKYKISSNSFVFKDDTSYKLSYKTYECGNNYYMFVKWNNKYSYILKLDPPASKKAVEIKKDTDLNGQWTVVDFCEDFDISKSDKYIPGHVTYPFELYLTKIIVKNGKANLYYSEGTSDNNLTINPSAMKIGNDKIKVYNVGGTKYMYYEWVNDDGNFFYVLKKTK